MLEFFRSNVSGFIGIAIIGLLVLAFAFTFGSQSKGWGEGVESVIAAKVDGSEIKMETLQYAVALRGGGRISESNNSSLVHSTLTGLVERQLLTNLARDMGISASTPEAEERIVKEEIYLTQSLGLVIEKINANPIISSAIAGKLLVSNAHKVGQTFTDEKGIFDLDMYKKFVRNYLRITEETFVEQQRLELIAERVRKIIAAAVTISQKEVKDHFLRQNDTVKLEYIRVIPAHFSQISTIVKEEQDIWAEANGEEIKKYYETNRFKYTNVEKMVRARHILVKTNSNDEKDTETNAREKIDNLLIRVKNGEDFASLAREFSDDTKTAATGGDLGFSPRGKMVSKFDDVMFNIKPGDISNIVETNYGFHIIKVEEIREGNISLSEATPEIAEKLYRELKGEITAKTFADELLEKLKAGETMSTILPSDENLKKSTLAPKVRTTRKLKRFDTKLPGFGNAHKIIKAAFKLDEKNPVPDKVFKVRDDYLVFRLIKRNKPDNNLFGKEKDRLTSNLLSAKQGTWLAERVRKLWLSAQIEGLKTGLPVPAPVTNKQKDSPKSNTSKEK